MEGDMMGKRKLKYEEGEFKKLNGVRKKSGRKRRSYDERQDERGGKSDEGENERGEKRRM